jgi:hypothetical protein
LYESYINQKTLTKNLLISEVYSKYAQRAFRVFNHMIRHKQNFDSSVKHYKKFNLFLSIISLLPEDLIIIICNRKYRIMKNNHCM